MGSICEREVLGMLACSKQALVLEHSKVQVLEHNKVQVLEHNKVQVLELERNKVQVQVHSKVLELEHSKVQVLEHSKEQVLEHSKEQVLEHSKELELVHSKVLVQVHNKPQVLGKLACNSEFAQDGSNAHALGGCEVARTNLREELGSKQSHMDLGSNHFHGQKDQRLPSRQSQ